MLILYTNHCPRCKVLEQKLKEKNIAYETCTDVKKMLDMGMKEAPMLEVDDRLLEFKDAMQYVGGM